MKRMMLGAALGVLAVAGLGAGAGPLAAQEAGNDAKPDEAMSAQERLKDPSVQGAMQEMMGEIFSADPLTPAEEARLPGATLAAEAVIPDGTLMRSLEAMQEGFFATLMDMGVGEGLSDSVLMTTFGLTDEELWDLSEDDRKKLVTLLDPQAAERAKLQTDAVMAAMREVLSRFEPSMRVGLARSYARRFTEEQLADINAFFATPSGRVYAAESWIAASDPQVMAAMGEAMPAMLGTFMEIGETVEEADDSLPPVRGYSELSTAERSQAAELLGISAKELSQRAAPAD